MRKFVMASLPILLAGFLLPDESCTAKHVEQQDGPYVFYKDSMIHASYIVNDHGTKKVTQESVPFADKEKMVLKVRTDVPGQFFNVRLKDSLVNEKTEYSNVTRQFVLSDIEGNFGAFRKLLQSNGVIDASYNWTFGNGHLVLVGDFVDRGQDVTEVLWLIYSLEDKAKAAGGYVHYVLGNHEIMIMSGDIRYVHQTYHANSMLLQTGYAMLFGENSELGRWLRTKNIMEKVGENLYVHGGISPEINRLSIPLPVINEITRPWYADSTYNYSDPKLIQIYESNSSPFWYRGYYSGDVKATPMQVDSTLSLYAVKQIVTGHSIVSDIISMWYGGKVINTDLEHAKGRSEALLIEGDKYYRVNQEGKKELL